MGRTRAQANIESGLLFWRLTVAAFVALLALCGYWIVSLGFEGAIAQGRFHYVLFAAIVAGILILGRFTIHRRDRGRPPQCRTDGMFPAPTGSCG